MYGIWLNKSKRWVKISDGRFFCHYDRPLVEAKLNDILLDADSGIGSDGEVLTIEEFGKGGIPSKKKVKIIE